MITKTVDKVVTIKKNIYVAADGKEFEYSLDCEQYEKKMNQMNHNEYIKRAEEIRIKEFDFPPIDTECIPYGENTFCWYNVETEEQFDDLNKAYSNVWSSPKSYPEIYCIETCGNEAYEDDSYGYALSDMMRDTIEFWKRFEYNVEITKSSNISETESDDNNE